MFRRGQKVVCIIEDWVNLNGIPCESIVVYKGIYTVTQSNIEAHPGMRFLILEEDPEHGYEQSCFRPLVERKTDISIFQKICDRETKRREKKLEKVRP